MRRGLTRPTTGDTPEADRIVASVDTAVSDMRPKPSRRILRWLILSAALLAVGAVFLLGVRWLLSFPFMQDFIVEFPGETALPSHAPVGIPAWLAWQHFFNSLLIVLIIRSGWRVRTEKRPRMFWTSRWSIFGKSKISLTQWLHQSIDVLWVTNGVVFFVLLFSTRQWMKIVPTSWAIFPNALSALTQYISLDWPTENGWVNYNSLQVLAYFTTVFIAAPLAIITGLRLSTAWPAKAARLNRSFPVEWARAIHFPVMIFFVCFIVAHVTLVLATGALRNLNHMFGGQDAITWGGFWVFGISILALAFAWIIATKDLLLAPIARIFGKVSR